MAPPRRLVTAGAPWSPDGGRSVTVRSLPAACSLLPFTPKARTFPRTGPTESLLKPALSTSKGVAFSTNQQRPLAENPAMAVGMVLRSPVMGGRTLGGALGANQLRPSGSHPRHVPLGPSSTSRPSPLGGWWRARVSGDRGAAFRGRVLPVLSSPGGRHWDSVAAKKRGHRGHSL